MEYERPEWKAGGENRPPTAEQTKAMHHPAAVAMAKRLKWLIEEQRPDKRARNFFRLSDLDVPKNHVGFEPAGPHAWEGYLSTLVDVGVLHRQATIKGQGYYYLDTHHTWPWIQVVLAEHKEP